MASQVEHTERTVDRRHDRSDATLGHALGLWYVLLIQVFDLCFQAIHERVHGSSAQRLSYMTRRAAQ